MVEITHQQARNLLQTAADKALAPKEKSALDEHINSCADCRTYAMKLGELQAGLRQAMHQRWDEHKPALSMRQIKERSGKVAAQTRAWVTFGKLAAVPLLVIAFLVAYQAAGPRRNFPAVSASSIPSPGETLYTPTPPARNTATQPATQNCDRMTYLVQENDSLDSIAARFSVSKATIMAYNGMADENLSLRAELVIPLCVSTSTPTTTTTITP